MSSSNPPSPLPLEHHEDHSKKVGLSSHTSSSSLFQLNHYNSPSNRSKTTFCGFQRKETVRCMVCGGKDCSKCGLNAYKKLEKPAIEKLHSSWITDYIVAMQRPNNEALEKGGALEDMKKKKITAVFNLTEPGEHPYCGTGILHDCGFPYTPEIIMKAGSKLSDFPLFLLLFVFSFLLSFLIVIFFVVKHFNFCWQDMTVPSIQQMMDIVNIAIHEIDAGGKIAVHCHAGFGRTGIAVACIMLAKEQLVAHNVINYVRKRR
jgi:hypothetical protein